MHRLNNTRADAAELVRLTDLDRLLAEPDGCCPACYQPVLSTHTREIRRHLDSLGRGKCPGSDQPWRIAVAAPTQRLSA